MAKRIVSLVLAAVFALSATSCALPSSFVRVESEAKHTEGSPASEHGTETEEKKTPSEPVIPTPVPGAPKNVCIDAGHGYVDPGCTTDFLNGQFERELVDDMAEKLKSELVSRGYNVVMLRDNDRYVTAAEVADAADAMGMEYLPEKLVDDGRFYAYNRIIWANVLHRETWIDALVSIHVDSFPEMEEVHGTRIHFCRETPYSEDSEELCTKLVEAIDGSLPDMKPRAYGEKWSDGYIVTKHGDMPSVLVECGFATNEEDAKRISDPEWRAEYAKALADGIDEYFN